MSHYEKGVYTNNTLLHCSYILDSRIPNRLTDTFACDTGDCQFLFVHYYPLWDKMPTAIHFKE